MSRVLTFVLHGTFAAQDSWWRLGASSFAGRLEVALARRGLAATVWRPALDRGFGYEDFAWSGDNTHAERIAASCKIASNLDSLAARLGATADHPLRVRLVAHSHGGNVALEMLTQLSDRVVVERLVLLGTPLYRSESAPRFFRLAAADLFLGVLCLCVAAAPLALVGLLASLHPAFASWRIAMALVLVAAVAAPLFAAVLVFVVRSMVEGIWRAATRLLAFAGRRPRPEAYGPSPKELSRRLGGRRVLSLSSRYDEADFLLHVSAAPISILLESAPVLGRASWSIALDLLADLVEVPLEVFVLGYPFRRLLLRDLAVSTPGDGSYPDSVLQRVDVSDQLAPSPQPPISHPSDVLEGREEARRVDRELLRIQDSVARVRSELDELGGSRKRLLPRAKNLFGYLSREIRLRHSRYYGSDAVLEMTADELADSVPAGERQ